MATSEIEKLERRYAENPQGLTFAPLAEVHRKNGDVGRALELLQAGLELHPNYIPASIVLGRCHQDMDDLPAAESAFAHVLRLDDENVIALKCLADINERLERFDAAEDWLHRLIAVDRSNEEAQEQLSRLETMKSAQTSSPPPEPATPVRGRSETDAAELEEPAASPIANLPLIDLEGTDLPPLEIAAPELARDTKEPTPPLVESHESSSAEAVEPLAGLVTGEFEPPKIAPSVGPAELGIETSDEVVLESSVAAEFRVPNASEDLMAPATAAPPRPSDNEGSNGSHQSTEERRGAPESDFVVTEAMAEAEVAGETKGQSVASFFHALLAARLPQVPGGTARDGIDRSTGSSASSPQEARSGGGAPGEDSVPVPPAVPMDQKTDAVVSFDDFFGSAERSGSADPNGEPGRDDLDQFQSWLQNLKR